MKRFKKLISTLVFVTLICGTSIQAFAATGDIARTDPIEISPERKAEAQASLDALSPDEVMNQIKSNTSADNTEHYQINEFDQIQELEEKSNAELIADGYTKDDIESIRNYDSIFDEQILTLAELSDESLKEFNYSSKQIDLIRNYDGSSSQRAALAATCNVTVDVDKCSYNASTKRTSSRVTTSFVWSGVPAIKLKDALMTGWNGWYLAGKTANIKYKYIYNSTTKWQTPTFITGNDGGTSLGCGYTFNSSIDDNYYYAVEGYEIFTVDTSGAKDMYATGLYAKRSVSATPSITFSLSGTQVSITVNSTTANYRGSDNMRVQY